MKCIYKMCLLLTLIGLSLSVKAQGPQPDPLDGILVTSYTASGSVQSPFSPASLTLNHTDNAEFDGSILLGPLSGDFVEGDDWILQVIAVSFEPIIPGVGNIIGMSINSTDGDVDFQINDTQTISIGLTFSKGQNFQGVNPAFLGNLVFTTHTAATLTPFGGSSVDLLNTAPDTLFATGDYVLNMEGVLNTRDSATSLVAHFNAIPEPSILAFVLIGMVLCTKAFRAGKR